MTTALVTGAGGFVARHLVPVLRRRGSDRIVGADIRGPAPPGLDHWLEVDLLDGAAARSAVASAAPDLVFHLVGAFRGGDAEIHRSNVRTAEHVLDAVRATAPAARVALVGSAAEYGRVPAALQPVGEQAALAPTTAYGRAKRAVTELARLAARERGVHVVLARPFNVVGAGMPDTLVVGAIVRRLRDALAGPLPRVIRIGTVTSIRDFVAAEDVAEGLSLALERGRPGEAYNLCSGEGHRVSEILARLLGFAGEPVAVEGDETLVRPGEVDALIGSNKKAARDLGWRPVVPLAASLRASWDAAAPAEASR